MRNTSQDVLSPALSLRRRAIARLSYFGIMFCAGMGMALAALAASHSSSPSAAEVALGHQLFQDPSLSADGKTACASCHQPDRFYTDGRPTSLGAFGRPGTRNTPSLLTVSDHQPLFWDGRRTRLDKAVLDPFLHPAELALSSRATLVKRLQTPAYRRAFTQAFGAAPASASSTLTEVGYALAAFVRAQPQPLTPFDRYQATHDPRTLSPQALAGLYLFAGSAGCSQCHRLEGTPVRFTDDAFHSTGTGLLGISAKLSALLHRISIQPTDIGALGREVGTHPDIAALGRFVVTHRPGDVGLFRTPSLRYVADTGPYMHDGSVPTLEAAVDQEVYWRGLASGQPLSLTVSERADLIAFLRALSLPYPRPTRSTKTVVATDASSRR